MSRVLPRLHRDTTLSVLAKFRGMHPAEALPALRKEIGPENPVVTQMVFHLCEGIEDRNNRGLAELCGLMTYAFLKSQGEADQLNHTGRIG